MGDLKGAVCPSVEVLASPLRKLLVSKKYLDWFEIDLNGAEIMHTIIVHKMHTICTNAYKVNVNRNTYKIKAKSQAGNI